MEPPFVDQRPAGSTSYEQTTAGYGAYLVKIIGWHICMPTQDIFKETLQQTD